MYVYMYACSHVCMYKNKIIACFTACVALEAIESNYYRGKETKYKRLFFSNTPLFHVDRHMTVKFS